MQKSRIYRYIAAFLFLGIGVVFFTVLNICIGSVKITVSDMITSLTGQAGNEAFARILWDIRLPRTVAVLILGGALALAGHSALPVICCRRFFTIRLRDPLFSASLREQK